MSSESCHGAHSLGNSRWGPYAIAGMMIIYFLCFLWYVALGFFALHSRPYQDLRPAIILYRLQTRTTFVATKVPLSKRFDQIKARDKVCHQ